MKKLYFFSLSISFALTVCFFFPTMSNAQSITKQPENLIIGEWFPVMSSQGLPSTGYTFSADAKITRTRGTYVVYKYELEGDTLILIHTRTIKQKAEITNTKLILTEENGNTKEWTRVGGDSNSGIIGKWTLDSYGLKYTREYTTSQNVIYTAERRSDEATYVVYPYELEGDTLITIITRTTKKKAEITNTKLIYTIRGNKHELTRVGGDSNSGIIGKWTGDINAGRWHKGSKQTWEFTNSQNAYYSLPMSSEEGTYEIKGNILEFGKTNKQTKNWIVDGDSLILTDSTDTFKFVNIK